MTSSPEEQRSAISPIAPAARARRSIGNTTLIRKIIERLPELAPAQLAALLYTVEREFDNRPNVDRVIIDMCIEYVQERSRQGSEDESVR